MKSKNAPQTRLQKIIPWLLPLLFAASLLVIQGPMGAYTKSLLSPDGPRLLYLPFIVNDAEQDTLLALVGLSLLVIYVWIIRKHTLRAIVFGGTATAFLLLLTILWITPSNGLTPINQVLQTLFTDDHTYHLVQQCYPHHGCSYTHIVLECDSSGWMCHTYSISWQKEAQSTVCTPPPPIASLAQNPATHELELTINSITQVLKPTDDIYGYQRSFEDCSKFLGLERD